jgi:exopolyphosphatase/guanosine-5'-triphosphate,3'-diphosphate pyrophosphatase
MRAVIDIGTNSILLLAGRLNSDGCVEAVLQKSAITRLGESLQGTGMVGEEAIERSERILDQYRSLLEQRGITEVTLVATEVLRVAKNSKQVIERIKNKFDWQIQVLSGEQEAQFSYIGALDVIQEQKRSCLVMDVGGGSSELILGTGNKTELFQSLPLGAVRLWEQMGKKECLTPEDRKHLGEVISDCLINMLSFRDKISPEYILIGIGGTITTLAAIQEGMLVYDADVVNGYCLNADQIETLYHKINVLAAAERQKIPGLARGREDIILYGIVIFLTFMKLVAISQVIVSDRGLRFGYLKHLEERGAED